ncbi:MAG: ATP-dependent sacrificial sulfur transferase LarE [Gemmatimonadaceae bacterium]
MAAPLAVIESAPDVTSDALAKEAALVAWLRGQGSVLVGYSGGVDSAYLAVVAVEALGAERVLAVIGRSASYPAEQWRAAREVADAFAVPVLEVDTDEMNDPSYAANPTNRCYFCKSELWTRLVPVARERSLAAVVDGTNADDLSDHRPGARAAAERDVRSPLAEVGLTKDEIRALSRRRGLPTWAQPSSPCLSSRIPYGTPVTPQRLARVEQAERALRDVGVAGDLRVRYHGDLARVEATPGETDRLLGRERARARSAVMAAGFARVAVDLRGFRSGSLNVLGGVGRDAVATSGASEPDATALARDLAAGGLSCEVERVQRLAVLAAAGLCERLADAREREAVLARARARGFTHAAVELTA